MVARGLLGDRVHSEPARFAFRRVGGNFESAVHLCERALVYHRVSRWATASATCSRIPRSLARCRARQ